MWVHSTYPRQKEISLCSSKKTMLYVLWVNSWLWVRERLASFCYLLRFLKYSWLSKHMTNGFYKVNFYLWFSWHCKNHYYATQTSDRIPKRFVDTISGTLLDYTKITYSTQPIPESTFDLPSFCSPTNLCQASACVRRRNSQLSQ